MPIMQHDKESNDLSSGRSLRVLFADDEPSIQELMRLELPRFGHEVTICPDGVTALTVLDQSEFDCVIVDQTFHRTKTTKRARRNPTDNR